MPLERSQERQQSLSVTDLHLDRYLKKEASDRSNVETRAELLADEDEVLITIQHVIRDGFAGAILVGPPGTSKSWYAAEIARKLTDGDDKRMRSVQFHPSYQYEDFVEGFVPNSSGGFDPTDKHFRLLCKAASNAPEKLHILVIDEISRCDAARVFGEALTYLETSKRGQAFRLSSGSEMTIPDNLFVLATMNPWDRGVDEMDVALDRRFAHIEMPPRSDLLAALLSESALPDVQEQGLIKFFEEVQRHPNAMCHIGHAYFARVTDSESLARLWRFQLKHVFARALRDDLEEVRKIEAMWRQLVETAGRDLAPLTAEPAPSTEQ